MFLITPSALLMDCPKCGSPLADQEDTESDQTCICGYNEPASSARVMTFLESALDNYLQRININTFRSDDKTIDATTGVLAAGCLPIFASRASELFRFRDDRRSQAIFPITSVPDPNAYLKERCVTTAHRVDVPFTLLMLVEVVHEALDLRPTFRQRHYANELPVKHLLESHKYGQLGSAMDISIKRTLNSKVAPEYKPGA